MALAGETGNINESSNDVGLSMGDVESGSEIGNV
jgi:hypothetical protein